MMTTMLYGLFGHSSGPSTMSEPRTLPELLSHAEKLARQLQEHLQYDVGPKAQRLIDAARPDPALLAASEEFTARVYREWVACSKQTDQMANELAAKRVVSTSHENGGRRPGR